MKSEERKRVTETAARVRTAARRMQDRTMDMTAYADRLSEALDAGNDVVAEALLVCIRESLAAIRRELDAVAALEAKKRPRRFPVVAAVPVEES